MASGKRARFRQIFLTHLCQVKGRLTLAVLCTLGVSATELLKPWPLKIILDHVVLDRKLPHALKVLLEAFKGSQGRCRFTTAQEQATC